MELVLVLVALAVYFYGSGRLIRWGSVRAGREVPGWWDIVGWLLVPALVRRGVRWAIPDSLGWPEMWIAGGSSLAVLFLVLVVYFRLRVLDAVLIWTVILVLGVLMMLDLLPMLTGGE